MSQLLRALERLLSGGDLRSIGFADQAARELQAGKWKPDEFLKLLEGASAVVRMRAADALEKATRESPELIAEAGDRLLVLLAATQPKEVRWHLLQMTSRIKWSCNQQERLLPAIEGAFNDRSTIVQVSALQALGELAPQAGAFELAFQRHLRSAMASPLPSVRARARRLAKHNGA